MAAALGAATFGALLVYLAITFIYTFYLKRKLLADVFALAILYTLRMLVGGAASGVLCSTWLLAFSVFQFLSLAFLKRSAELSGLARNRGEEVAGRSYFTWDLVQVNVFGVTAAYLSSLVLGLYIAGDRVRILYQQPGWLWMLVPLHLYWMSRAWILSHRGAMNEDPITFAVTDRSTWLCAGISAILLTLATLGGLSFPGVAQ
jgi:4-hydroxybenzoate polyprenyltransferase